jgi:DNA-directed RNA polymerase subunit RPC12/RpoP
MLRGLPFAPGVPPVADRFLARFLLPLEGGVVERALRAQGWLERTILDPFGASPSLAMEAARAGCAVLVASANPVLRFLLRYRAQPLARQHLQAALARLASSTKDGDRLERFLRDLYRTLCSRCGASVSARQYIWERQSQQPILKEYLCPRCGHKAVEATSGVDRGRAASFGTRGLHYAMALEKLAPLGDPYREHAAAALDVYPPRALYALVTLMAKVEQLAFEPPLRQAAQALLLYAMDTCNALWAYPEGRQRPRQLSLSPHYREYNLWLALEQAVEEWSSEGGGVALQAWSEGQAMPKGTITLFAGSIRELVERGALPEDLVVVTALPRPNQAFWTLSALWASWLWGRSAAAHIRVALRRRRYDWGWHARALRGALAHLQAALAEGTPLMAFMPEAEPGFVYAGLVGMDAAGFALRGWAVRAHERQALFLGSSAPLSEGHARLPQEKSLRDAARKCLLARGEPTPFLLLQGAVVAEEAAGRRLAGLLSGEDPNPLQRLASQIHAVLASKPMVNLSQAADPEAGLYWLSDGQRAAELLADRVECMILDLLRNKEAADHEEMLAELYRAFVGELIPDWRLVAACLTSYATRAAPGAPWQLRPEDRADARRADIREVKDLLAELGSRLGFEVEGETPIIWRNPGGEPAYSFRVQETAQMDWLFSSPRPASHLVIPGGRSALLLQKARRDPRLRSWLRERSRVIKFRHVRRLALEPGLTFDTFPQRLALDPPEHQDPQLPLL